MSKPLPPIVHDPITLFSRVVRVTAVAANATVEVMVDGNTVDDVFSSSGGTAWVSVDVEQPLPAPGVGQPLIVCRTAIDFFGMTPSVDVDVENEGMATGRFNVATAYKCGAHRRSGREN